MKRNMLQQRVGLGTRPGRIALMSLLVWAGLSTEVSAVDISSSPLVTASTASPNVFFVFDDSGSMQFEFLPENLLGDDWLPPGSNTKPFPYFVFPGQDGAYGGSEKPKFSPTFSDDNFYSFFMRSPHNNKAFYDPALTYEPWMDYENGGNVSFPDSDPAAARWHPVLSTDTLDLTIQQSRVAPWLTSETSDGKCGTNYAKDDTASPPDVTCSFYPVTYYLYKGSGDERTKASYVRYQYRAGAFHRKDLGTGTEVAVSGDMEWGRPQSEELQNFANWFTYYRSRLLASQGSASLAFGELGDGFRVGYLRINARNDSSALNIPTNLTAGSEFSGAHRAAWYQKLLDGTYDNLGTPLREALGWVGDKYSSATGPYSDGVSCRQSYAVLTTDGYWKDPSSTLTSKVGNADGSNGSEITGPKGESYTYTAEAPYSDTVTGTLADVAMYYWNRDLQTNLENNVPKPPGSPAFWQNMVTIGVTLGAFGSLDPETDLPALTDGSKSWPSIDLSSSSPGPERVDDLWHATVNSRGTFIAAATPTEFADGLRAALRHIQQGSASTTSLGGNTTSVSSGSMIFQASYKAGDWQGELSAWSIGSDGQVSADPLWRASEHMSGSRKIFTIEGGTKKEFTAAGISDATLTDAVVEYLRGNRSGEVQNGGTLRNRGSVLGDIVNSSPVYSARTQVVFVGANDGMLHAFDASSTSSTSELFAYIPSELLSASRIGALSDPNYSHQFYVDGSLVVQDVPTATGVRSILVGTLGRGGKTIFALDVTDPANFDASDILWEYQDSDLGYVLGEPIIAPLNNDKWYVIAGGGYNSGSGNVTLHLIDLLNGPANTDDRLEKITVATDASSGLGGVGGWDDDGDGTLDLAYAGDLNGNLWKFDLSASSPNSWDVEKRGGSASPMAKLKYGTGASAVTQPITAAPIVAVHPDSGERWVFVGTGKFFSASDNTDNSVQTWYGLQDDGALIDGRATLVERVIKSQGSDPLDYRLISTEGDATGGAAMSASNKGWYIDLIVSSTASGERMLVRNAMLKNVLLGFSLDPAESSACGNPPDGWVYAVNPWIGGRTTEPFFDITDDGKVDGNDEKSNEAVGAIRNGNGGRGYIQRCDDGLVCVTAANPDGNSAAKTTRGKDGVASGRQTWRQLLND